MIQTDPKYDRGQALFSKFESAITHMVMARKKQWFDSPQYRGLQNNCKQMDLYIDNAAPAVSTFISDISPQTIRRGYNEFTALFNKFLETDPLFSVRRNAKVTAQQEHDIISVLTDNLEKTYYRERCLQWSIDHIVRYGTALTYTFAVDDYNANSLMTIKSESGDYEQVQSGGDNAVLSTAVHPLNGIVDPRSNFMVAPDYMGFIGDICVANIATLLENPAYIAKNLREVFSQCKNGLPDEHWWSGTGSDARRDYTKGHSNITYIWTRLPFEGNEDDPAWYAVELIGDKIIRIEENSLDGNTIPLAIKRILPRQYTWYGNSPLADKIAIQNMQYWLINTVVESTARLQDRVVLYRDGELDIEAINSRHQTGGWVPYKGQEQDLSRLMFSPALPNVAYRESDWLMQEMRREDQESSAMPNFNPMSAGGPTNKTLGGAQMMAGIGEMKMSAMVNQMCVGLKDVAKHQLALIKQISRDSIQLSDGNQVSKDVLLGDYQLSVKISNVFNYLREAQDAENRMNAHINRMATGLPHFKAVKLGSLIKDCFRNGLKRESIGDYVDEELLSKIDEQFAKAAMQPPAPPPEQQAPKQEQQQKPPSTSISFKDLPIDGQVQMAAQAGIMLQPDVLAAHKHLELAPAQAAQGVMR
jgi:hypothetical protein